MKKMMASASAKGFLVNMPVQISRPSRMPETMAMSILSISLSVV